MPHAAMCRQDTPITSATAAMTASQPSPAAGSTETVDTVPPHQPALFPSHYPTPFSAIATLLAGCLLRCEQSSGTYAHVDLEMQQQQGPHQQHQLPVLVVEDDAAGLSPQQLRRSVGIPQRANSTVGSSGAAGGTGSSKLPDLVHAALRLGSLALVLTKRRQQGASVALLTCTSAAGDVEAVVVDFAADGSQQLAPARKAGVPATAAAPAAATAPPDSEAAVGWQAAMDAIGRLWPSHGSKARLQQLLDAMPEQGTRLLIAQLRRASHTGGAAEAAAYELDWAGAGDLKAADVLGQVAAAGAAGTGVLPSPQGGQWLCSLCWCLTWAGCLTRATCCWGCISLVWCGQHCNPCGHLRAIPTMQGCRSSRSRRQATPACSAAWRTATPCVPTWASCSCAGRPASACGCAAATCSTHPSGARRANAAAGICLAPG